MEDGKFVSCVRIPGMGVSTIAILATRTTVAIGTRVPKRKETPVKQEEDEQLVNDSNLKPANRQSRQLQRV
ncbi:unnamed protein product [Penicillium roqueforti FM164]|uniref:Uncharacterized protein n=1 Tax=Penicillium roqueforti (strain FM164) TaxID=1365484 RepID=W6QK59_PENRF|nr:unnamed protein product [Penicillium roqueforti FM164]